MILITGGKASGKTAFTNSLLSKVNNSDEIIVADNVNDHIDENKDIASLADRLCKNDIVIINEVGCGVVPIDKIKRIKREQTGRLSCLLAQRADIVIRMVCGIPVYIKGTYEEVEKWLLSR